MDSPFQFTKLCHIESGRLFLVLGILAIIHILCQSLMLPYKSFLLSLMADGKTRIHGGSNIVPTSSSEVPVPVVGNSLLVNASDSIGTSLFVEVLKNVNSSNVAEEIGSDNGLKTRDVIVDDDFVSQHRGFHTNFENSEDLNGGDGDGSKFEKTVDVNASFALNKVENLEVSTTLEMTSETSPSISLEQMTGTNPRISAENLLHPSSDKFEDRDTAFAPPMLVANSVSTASISLPRDSVTVKNDSSTPAKKKFRSQMPPKSITSIHEMNDILIRHRRSSRAMRPRWSSMRDQEILAARSQIGSAPIVKNHPGLYAPIFRNVSTFKESYELMERTLKVYAYKDGQKPIFHQPELKGLYASEGWFMKLMEGNKHFLVKDPRKAHLFYIPFSSRMLEYALYVPNSHNRTNLRLYLKGYQEKIAAKYSFWNRTGGADHFLVACHDWAPYETRHHMENCIKAFCNADVTAGFKIGRDVSFPETYVRSARNPLRDLGGKPPSERRTLAFYAGNLHGYLRPILLKHWKDRDVNMKIFGPIPKAEYIHHMKNSKYCICPKGYEVNSPRVVEAIFYECVPVIVSDNFVPPFFEVLDWGAFAIVLEEKDVPDLRDVLVSIPEERYLAMQRGVRKVQRHFLWHAKPVKYDLFHMTLHSIWHNRVFQIKGR